MTDATDAVEAMLTRAEIAHWAEFGRGNRSFLRAALATIAPLDLLAGVAAGTHVIVPREPTRAMVDAAYAAYYAYKKAETGGWGGLDSAYRTMLAAAPDAAVPSGQMLVPKRWVRKTVAEMWGDADGIDRTDEDRALLARAQEGGA